MHPENEALHDVIVCILCQSTNLKTLGRRHPSVGLRISSTSPDIPNACSTTAASTFAVKRVAGTIESGLVANAESRSVDRQPRTIRV